MYNIMYVYKKFLKERKNSDLLKLNIGLVLRFSRAKYTLIFYLKKHIFQLKKHSVK